MTPALKAEGGQTVRVVPLLRLHHLGDRTFDYLVPPEMGVYVERGSILRVPFGGRSVRAVVVEDSPAPDSGRSELREIESILPDSVSPELLELARRVSERYLASYESCLRLVVPPEAGTGATGGRRGPGWLIRTVGGSETEEAVRLTAKQRALLEAIPDGGGPLAEVCEAAGCGRSVAKILLDKGLAALVAEPNEPSTPSPMPAGPSLWPEQESALDGLLSALEAGGFEQRLLWGVTGSGKTEVYLRLIERVLARGDGAILLVPEIALTPQMISRVRARFGSLVGVLHSGLAKGERLREFRRIASGEAKIAVGARSAVFAPLPNLRTIIVDEAHDTSYKQEEEPRYHAATVAAMRLAATGGLLVEGTATPTVEAMAGQVDCLRLEDRAAGAHPSIEVVDMRSQSSDGLLSPRAREALAVTLRRGEQAIVLLNRRGYSAYVHCHECGHVMKCADCDLSLTYHSASRRLLCHHCGRVYRQPDRCPACGGPPLTRGAPGTERLDDELRMLVPGDAVFRMDSDVASSGTRLRKILEDFAEAAPGVLVGTQMVAKGHDFPNVTLVVVADADTGLYVPDFRAAERTFQLLTQVSGRAGRAERPGHVVVQTWNPDVPCIKMALHRQEQGFYAQELEFRSKLGYPPFKEIIRLVVSAREADKCEAAARHLRGRLASHFPADELRGPANLPALRGKQRWHLLVVSGDGERARAIIGAATSQLAGPYRNRGVVLLADVDPLSFG